MYLAIQRRRSKSDSSETPSMASCPGLALGQPGWEPGKVLDRMFVGFGDHDVRFWPVSDQVIAYRRRNSHLSLLGHFQRVIHFYTEIADRAFELCMT